MSTVRLEKQRFRLAALGPENPLPDFQNVSYVHARVDWDPSLTEEDTRYMRYGRVSSILPYLAQDGYTRHREETEKDVVVLENNFVRAEFLPWMGGRLRSLVCEGRQLLHVNPVIQPCNLALRNAWCSGGVEWNVGIRGHNMLTNAPMFTELFSLPDGTACVRFYEYERIRGVAYRVEGYLPPDSRLLYVQVHIENPPGNGERPMYWWSNMAVPEEAGTRVVAPADTAIISLYDEGRYRMLRTALPEFKGVDLSRPAGIGRSQDVFFDIKKDAVPFIAALQGDHTGLVQCSTARLLGRKLFVWGMGRGGRHWQRFLSDGTENYIEIQAGIAKTQQDHIPMPENVTWSWLEAYGKLTCDIEGLSYAQAAERCAQALEGLQSRRGLEEEFSGRGREVAAARGELVLSGSGWGALENARREKAGLPPVSARCRFPASSMGGAQAPWLALLREGRFPAADPLEAPEGYMTGAWWQQRLRSAPPTGAGRYQLGVMQYASGEKEQARQSLLACLETEENPWALRALARISKEEGAGEACLAYFRRALRQKPEDKYLSLEYAQALLELGLAKEMLSFLDGLAPALAALPRFRFLRAAGDVEAGRWAEAEEILLEPLVIPDMREGELSLSDLWFSLYEKKEGLTREEAQARHPLPEALDFRMR